MASFKLGRFFSQPEILRGIDPENLLSLLADHAKALEALGFALPEADAAASIDYDALASLLMEPDKLPTALREAFYFIHEMATPEGMECLLEAAEEAGIEIVGTPGPTPGDAAVQVWLKDRELLERKHAEQFLRNPRTFESFGTAVSPVPKYRDPMKLTDAMKKDLDDDETFAEAQNRLALHARPRRDIGQLLAPAYRPFTGMIFCEECGSVCYQRTSKNHKGEYRYYSCGCRQRNGPGACDNRASVREDLLMERIKRTYEEVFADADSIIEDAIEEARKLMQSNCGELQRVRGQIGELDKKIGSMTRLLVDPDIEATAKRAVSRQIGELEAERERLQNAVAELASDANDNTARLASAVRQALGEAQESLATVTTPTEIRDFIEQYVGPMMLKRNGEIERKGLEILTETQTAPAEAEAVKRSIAGVGLEPTTSGL